VTSVVGETCGVDAAKRIETVIAEVLKPRGFRKRARSWFRTTAANEYQIVNLQKSAWGSGSCYLNLGWDAAVAAREFRPENQCAIRFRAEETDVIQSIKRGLQVTLRMISFNSIRVSIR
jgi:hypothetical protein